jgi:hypothetical protein
VTNSFAGEQARHLQYSAGSTAQLHVRRAAIVNASTQQYLQLQDMCIFDAYAELPRMA